MSEGKCPLGEDCDLTLAYMMGVEKAKDTIKALRADNERLKAAVIERTQVQANNIAFLDAENDRLRAALEEAIEFVDQAEMALTPRGEAYVARWRAAIAAQPAPSAWRTDALVTAANAIIDFYNGPAEAKRPDIFQRLMQRLANALPPAPGKEEA